MNGNQCPACGATNAVNSVECKYCGEALANQFANSQGFQQANQFPNSQGFQQTNFQQPQYSQQGYQQPMMQQPHYQQFEPQYVVSTKSKIAAGILGILLGGLGIHKFYLGRVGWGIVYLLFCWTYIPAIVGFIEGIIYLCTSDEQFARKYGKRVYRQ